MSVHPIPFSKRFQWRFECFIHSVIEFLARLMPGSWVFHFGEALAGIAWYLMPKRRKIVLRNLRIAYSDQMDLDEIKQLAKRSFKRAGANLLSSAYTAGLPAEKLSKVLEVENPELLQKFADEGKGVVLLLSHMGNWELLSRLIYFIPEGVGLGGMYRPLNNPYMDERVRARRQADGSRMFSKRDPFHQITAFLRDGGVVGVLADQRVGINGDTIRFFGRLTKASPLPSLLARRSKSDVLALSLSTTRPGKWKATLSEVETPPSTGNCMAALEAAMRQSPEDVFWLQERWRVRLGPKVSLRHLLGDETGCIGKGHRALLWLVGLDRDMGGIASLPPWWLHPDVVYEVATDPGLKAPSWLPPNTQVHEVGPWHVWYAELGRIDVLQALPIDFVLCIESSDELRSACRRELIPLYLHGDSSRSNLRTDGKNRSVP